MRDQALTRQESAKVSLTDAAATAAIRYREAYAIFPHPDIDVGAALRRLGPPP